MSLTSFALSFVLFSCVFAAADTAYSKLRFGPQSINLWRLDAREKVLLAAHPSVTPLVIQDTRNIGFSASPIASSQQLVKFPEQHFVQPIDHHNHTIGSFGQRYWVNTRHYVPGSGGPVIVLDGGETNGEDRIPFLDTGIVDILAKATGGVGVVLEHRYYGKSRPVSNLSTDNLRWLTNDQAAADSANFMANVKFCDIDEDLTAPNVPWIYYGGSYAGARSAHMRVLYPELVFGAIASSAVTHATLSNWEYYDVIRQAADPSCTAHIENTVKTLDILLEVPYLNPHVKGLFGLQNLEHDNDFMSVIETPLGYWQDKNWNPTIGSRKFDEFCEALNKPIFGAPDIVALPVGHEDHLLSLPGGHRIDVSILNYAQYIRESLVKRCLNLSMTVEECFGTYNDTAFLEATIDQDWRLWTFQVCTEWGYFFTAPPDPEHPRIVSKLMTMDYATKICQQAFPPGKYFTVPPLPNITAVNALGDFAIAADRLAFIDGDVDPWKPCTPHSVYGENREDTILRPFKLIPGGVHHYDENGLRNITDEPPEIQKIHYEMVNFVLEWLDDFEV